jgi:LL-diaminopimelate aminotransferase
MSFHSAWVTRNRRRRWKLREKLAQIVLQPEMHNYSLYEGMREFREAACRYLQRRYGMHPDPDSQCVWLIGLQGRYWKFLHCFIHSRAHLNLVPELAYPIPATMSAHRPGRNLTLCPYGKKRGFLPDLDSIPDEILKWTDSCI